METLEAIRTRRSIRIFTGEPIARDVIRRLIAAGMAAPTAGNQQDWHFVALDDPNVLGSVPDFHPFAKMALTAGAGIAVCADLTLEKHPGYWVQDCAASTQNILLAAHDLGLGAVWTGIHPREDRVAGLRALLGLPGTIMPLSLVLIGIPAEHPEPEDRFREERIHWNQW